MNAAVLSTGLLSTAVLAFGWSDLMDWFDQNAWVFGWLLGISVGSIVLCIVLLPIVVARLPADYFVARRQRTPQASTAGGIVLRVLRNLLGFVVLLAGLLMLVLPGQGLLFVLILLDFPGKRALERRLVRRPSILKLLNGMREKRGKPPLRID